MSMADPWNLTLDQSCFEDWNEEGKSSIADREIDEVYKQLDSIELDGADLQLISSVEEKLTISFLN